AGVVASAAGGGTASGSRPVARTPGPARRRGFDTLPALLRITPLLTGSRGAPPAVADVIHRATGSEARAFAAVIRKHTLEGTGGQTYAQMGPLPGRERQAHERREGRRHGFHDRPARRERGAQHL